MKGNFVIFDNVVKDIVTQKCSKIMNFQTIEETN